MCYIYIEKKEDSKVSNLQRIYFRRNKKNLLEEACNSVGLSDGTERLSDELNRIILILQIVRFNYLYKVFYVR